MSSLSSPICGEFDGYSETESEDGSMGCFSCVLPIKEKYEPPGFCEDYGSESEDGKIYLSEVERRIASEQAAQSESCIAKARVFEPTELIDATNTFNPDRVIDLPPGNKSLDWKTRMKITEGVAKALEYLHNQKLPPIIYGGLKTTGILLDENYNPKLSDLNCVNHVARSGYTGEHEKLAYGYIAAELFFSSRVSFKSDVYSFGVVLLELISGRKAIDRTRTSGEISMALWARRLLRSKKFKEIADPLMKGQYPYRGLVQALGLVKMCIWQTIAYPDTAVHSATSFVGAISHKREHIVRIIGYPDFDSHASWALGAFDWEGDVMLQKSEEDAISSSSIEYTYNKDDGVSLSHWIIWPEMRTADREPKEINEGEAPANMFQSVLNVLGPLNILGQQSFDVPDSTRQPLDWNARLKMAERVSKDLKHLYSRNAIVRDLKPHNILLGEEFDPKLADFGLAMFNSSVTRTPNYSAETIGYMDPWNYEGRRHSPKLDIDTLGMILFELMTERKTVPADLITHLYELSSLLC
ncbi:uncharacterized protein LOC113311560 [Papaver somniferum]|uniref:uncharacterized protein LOC113311560 n=1 Tax=Papaver somniferum TaxID=3469 RepID=UPI000E6FDEBD|nr:uncharacterized protein LOC113311560 [Papaver somniferum]